MTPHLSVNSKIENLVSDVYPQILNKCEFTVGLFVTFCDTSVPWLVLSSEVAHSFQHPLHDCVTFQIPKSCYDLYLPLRITKGLFFYLKDMHCDSGA